MRCAASIACGITDASPVPATHDPVASMPGSAASTSSSARTRSRCPIVACDRASRQALRPEASTDDVVERRSEHGARVGEREGGHLLVGPSVERVRLPRASVREAHDVAVARELGEPRPLRRRMRQRLRRDAGGSRGHEHAGAAGRGVQRGRVEHEGHELHGCRGRPVGGIRPAERRGVEQAARGLRGRGEHDVRRVDHHGVGLVVGRARHDGVDPPPGAGRGIRSCVGAARRASQAGDLGARSPRRRRSARAARRARRPVGACRRAGRARRCRPCAPRAAEPTPPESEPMRVIASLRPGATTSRSRSSGFVE